MSSSGTNNIIKSVASPRNQQNYQNFKGKNKKNPLEKLPFWNRYRRATIFGGAFLTFCIIYSAPIYYFFRTPPEHIDPRSTMWPGEIAKGKTYLEQFRERQLKIKAEAEAKKAAAAAKNN